MQPYISGEFVVSAVKKERYADIFYHEGGDRWYKVKANYITIDEKTAAEKKTANMMLVQASSFEEALKVFMDGMKDTMADFEIASITETALMDVFAANLSETLADKEKK